MNSSYITSAKKANQLPPEELPEVAFLGRSNCGKSTLLNAILGRKSLARVSGRPGRTQMANFFQVHSKDGDLMLVDLPGYGFSAIGRTSRSEWEQLADAYLRRRNIRTLYFLIDIRRDLEPDEVAFLRTLPGRLVIVLTKADKVSKTEAMKKHGATTATLIAGKVGFVEVQIVSSLKKSGLDALWQLALE